MPKSGSDDVEMIEGGETSIDPIGDPVLDDVKEKKGFLQKWKEKRAEAAAQPKVSYGTLFRYATKLDAFLMIFGAFGSLSHGVILPLFALIFGELIDSFALPADELFDKITEVAVYFVYAGLGALVMTYVQNAFWSITGHRQIEKIRSEYVKSILRQEIGWFDTQDTGELTARISGDTVLVQEALGDKVGSALQFMATFIGGFVLGFTKGWKLTLVILAISPLLAAGAAFMGTMMANLTNKGQKAYAKAGGVATEVIGGIRTVAAFGGEERELERYSKNLEEARKMGNRRGFVSGFGLGLTLFIMFSSYALALWYGSVLVIDEEMTGGEILTVFFSVLIGAFSLGQMGPSVEAIGKGRGAAYVIFQTIDRDSLINPFSEEGKKLEKIIGKIELRSVHFHYPTRPEVKVLRGFSLRVEPGQTVALVGESGSGKSSTIQLIQRFYDPEEGSVLVDGKDIVKLNPKWWRQQIGLVGQEPVLFSGTIADNIQMGKPGASREEIIKAAKLANAHKFISKFPKGYDTPVGEKGAQMSGGQKQRIAIARAIIRNPKILLLDEATSALDTESEKIVQEALDAVKLGRTTIVVAHRLSTIRDADVICVLSEGKIAEKGTHDELMASGTLYPELVKAQQGEQKEKKTETKVRQNKDDKKTSEAVVLSGKKEESDAQNVSLRRIYGLNAPEWPYILLGIFSSICTGAVNPLFAIVFSEMINLYFQPPDDIRRDVPMWAGLFVGIGGIPLIFNTLQLWMFAVAGEHLTARLRRMTFKAILDHPPSWFDSEEHSTGALTSRLSRDTTLVEGLVGGRLGLTVQNIVTVTTGLVIAFIYGWKLTLVILAASPAIIFANAMHMFAMTGMNKQNQKANEKANQIATEAIGNIRTIAAFTQEEQTIVDYTTRLHRPTILGIRRAHLTGFLMGLSELFLFCTYTLGFWYGGKLTADGEMSFDDVMKVFMAIVLSAMSIGQTAAISPDASKAKTAAAAVFDIIDDAPEYSSFSEEGKRPKKVKGSLKLSKLQFSYPTRLEAPVLRKLSISAKPGKVVALVGESGCGKSSTVSLIERFYDPRSGTVSLDGVDIRELNLHWFRQKMGLVGQEPILFSGTIAENIAYGKPDASREEIEAAAKSANAHKFISEFPRGYDTPVGEKGAQLSGGQKQRIAIARAIIRNPKILLLDEATSALDTESEKIVQEALDAAMKGRTTIVIAHRLSTIRNADKIAVIENGRVVEEGTHSQLMELGGAYSKLVARQIA